MEQEPIFSDKFANTYLRMYRKTGNYIKFIFVYGMLALITYLLCI
jgi:hypothetical protein